MIPEPRQQSGAEMKGEQQGQPLLDVVWVLAFGRADRWYARKDQVRTELVTTPLWREPCFVRFRRQMVSNSLNGYANVSIIGYS